MDDPAQPDLQWTALVTGAPSGIGEAYAIKLASMGYDLILVARQEHRLRDLVSQCSERYGVRCEVLAADSLHLLGKNRVVCIPGVKNRIIVAIARSGFTSFLMRNLRRFVSKHNHPS